MWESDRRLAGEVLGRFGLPNSMATSDTARLFLAGQQRHPQ